MKSKILRRNAAYQKQVEALLERLAASDDSVLNMSAMDGGWSAIQTAHHLILTEELSLKYVQKKLSFQPKLEVPGPDSWFRSNLLALYLYLPFKFKAPDAVGDQSLPGFTSLADTRARWLKIRQDWTDFLEQLPGDLVDKSVYRHPFAGRFGWPGMLRFFQNHFTRHQKQIFRTLGY
ncbi:MAG: DinB family protein [Lewinellaceae bacterium]|nr:DinB family protein [Lewinellaceae bacterium]